jgi:hypothetical protein
MARLPARDERLPGEPVTQTFWDSPAMSSATGDVEQTVGVARLKGH